MLYIVPNLGAPSLNWGLIGCDTRAFFRPTFSNYSAPWKPTFIVFIVYSSPVPFLALSLVLYSMLLGYFISLISLVWSAVAKLITYVPWRSCWAGLSTPGDISVSVYVADYKIMFFPKRDFLFVESSAIASYASRMFLTSRTLFLAITFSSSATTWSPIDTCWDKIPSVPKWPS